MYVLVLPHEFLVYINQGFLFGKQAFYFAVCLAHQEVSVSEPPEPVESCMRFKNRQVWNCLHKFVNVECITTLSKQLRVVMLCISNVLYSQNIIFIVIILRERSMYVCIVFKYSVCKVDLYFIAYVIS